MESIQEIIQSTIADDSIPDTSHVDNEETCVTCGNVLAVTESWQQDPLCGQCKMALTESFTEPSESFTSCACHPAEKCQFKLKDVSGSLHKCVQCKRKIFGPCGGFEDSSDVLCRFCQPSIVTLDIADDVISDQEVESKEIEMKEDINALGLNHPHMLNRPIFRSANDTYDFLSELRDDGRVHKVFFNNQELNMRVMQDVNPSYVSKAFACTGDADIDALENRIYYGYDILMGVISGSRGKKGYVCPSVIVHVNNDGKHEDTGRRLIRLLKTLCVKPQLHALIYSLTTEKIEMVKPNFVMAMGNDYTAWHIPFEYDDTIKG